MTAALAASASASVVLLDIAICLGMIGVYYNMCHYDGHQLEREEGKEREESGKKKEETGDSGLFAYLLCLIDHTIVGSSNLWVHSFVHIPFLSF